MTVYNKRRESLEVNIRLARLDDAPDIITLIIKQHGNYYPYADFYSMDFVYSAIQKRNIYIIVAELSNGRIAGIIGANGKTQFTGTLEWIMLIIRPSCRGFGLGKSLIDFLYQTLPPDEYASVYGHCMSLDTASQGILAGLGHRMTGALLNCYRLDARAENLSGLDLPVKHNLLVTCMPEDKKSAGVLYAPAAHAGYIRGVYEILGAEYALRDEKTAAPSGVSPGYTVAQNEDHRYCEVFAKEINSDFEKILGDALRQYGSLNEQSFNVFINLNDPAAPWAASLLEDRGFSFAGLHALSGPYEYMIFHYSPALPIPFDRIAVLSGFAGNFAYIRNQYEGRTLNAH